MELLFSWQKARHVTYKRKQMWTYSNECHIQPDIYINFYLTEIIMKFSLIKNDFQCARYITKIITLLLAPPFDVF